MGDGIAGQISKGPVHKKVDDHVNHMAGGVFDKRAAFLTKLQAATTWQPYLQMLETDVGLTQAESNYLRTKWYDTTDPGVSWKNLQPIYPVLRQGLIKALQEAGTTLPLDSYWLPVGGPPMLAVIVARSPVQVTRLIITPGSHMPAAPRTQNSNMWAVTAQPQGQPVQQGDVTSDAVVDNVNAQNVVTWRRREFYTTPSATPAPGPAR